MPANKTGPTAYHPPCTSSQFPTMVAWEGTGVWVLNLTEEQSDAYNLLPPTFDENEHLKNLKNFGAVWYANGERSCWCCGYLDMEGKVSDKGKGVVQALYTGSACVRKPWWRCSVL